MSYHDTMDPDDFLEEKKAEKKGPTMFDVVRIIAREFF